MGCICEHRFTSFCRPGSPRIVPATRSQFRCLIPRRRDFTERALAGTYAHTHSFKESRSDYSSTATCDRLLHKKAQKREGSAVCLRAAFGSWWRGRDAEEGEDARSSPSRPLLIDPLSAHKQQITAIQTPFLSRISPHMSVIIFTCFSVRDAPSRSPKTTTLSTYLFFLVASRFLRLSFSPPIGMIFAPWPF